MATLLMQTQAIPFLSLPPEADSPARPRPDLERLDLDALCARAVQLRVFPAVFNNIRALGLLDCLSPESVWVERFRQNYVRNLALRHEEAQIVNGLSQAGIPCRAVKGVGLVELLYPDLSWRSVEDIDLLVAAGDVALAYHRLKELGLRDAQQPWTLLALSRQIAQPPYAFPEILLIKREFLIELHWDWVGENFPPGAPASDQEAFLTYLCLHAGKSFWSSLQKPCDIELYLRKFGDRIEWGRFWRLAKKSGWDRICAASFHLCSILFERPLRPEEQRGSTKSARVLADQAARALLGEATPGWWSHRAFRLLRVYGWRQRISRCWRWLAPPPWHWNHPPGASVSTAGVWMTRYRQLLSQALARLVPFRRWSHYLQRAGELSLADWRCVGRAILTLLAVYIGLRIVPFDRLQRWATSVRTGAPEDGGATGEAIRRTAWLVDVAANHHVVPMRCLARSLALAWMLARRGISTQVKLGVRKDGEQFLAHAWLEWRGERVNDPHQVAQQFVELAPAPSQKEFSRALLTCLR
ncbi:MAG: lasso peptide biosynthesis B2 protein [Acidobacteria bacterium]|nr:lasso peptide biosynthesis B2 protein [Acidobacteriota bacterium]